MHVVCLVHVDATLTVSTTVNVTYRVLAVTTVHRCFPRPFQRAPVLPRTPYCTPSFRHARSAVREGQRRLGYTLRMCVVEGTFRAARRTGAFSFSRSALP